MKSQTFHDFDAFVESIRDVESRMLLRNPRRRLWSISLVDLQGVHVQLGRLGSGNIAEGELQPNGYMLYMPLTDACEYSANGTLSIEIHSRSWNQDASFVSVRKSTTIGA